jgi:hypothetical protein
MKCTTREVGQRLFYPALPESVPKWLLPDEQFEKAVHLSTFLSMDHLNFLDSCYAFIAARVMEASHFARGYAVSDENGVHITLSASDTT